MKKSHFSYMRISIFVCLVCVLLYGKSAHAYIDPGTSSVAFSALGYIFSMAALGIAFFIRPVRSLMKTIFTKLTRRRKLVENEQNES